MAAHDSSDDKHSVSLLRRDTRHVKLSRARTAQWAGAMPGTIP
jgi:hypothetical protein